MSHGCAQHIGVRDYASCICVERAESRDWGAYLLHVRLRRHSRDRAFLIIFPFILLAGTRHGTAGQGTRSCTITHTSYVSLMGEQTSMPDPCFRIRR